MAQVTAQMVKALRDKTDAGMMACKRALVESDGDMDQAVDVLRKAGVTKAQFDAGQLPKSRWFDWKREQDELKAAESEQ